MGVGPLEGGVGIRGGRSCPEGSGGETVAGGGGGWWAIFLEALVLVFWEVGMVWIGWRGSKERASGGSGGWWAVRVWSGTGG